MEASFNISKENMNMKKLICAILCLMMLSGCAMAEALYTPGTYTGVGQGIGGDVTVEVVFTESAIESIKVVSHSETAGICEPAIEKIPAAIVDQQTLMVDAITGVTVTTKAILAAVEDCAAQAGADVSLLTGKTELPENTYEGVGKGIGGEVKVQIVVVDGRIESVVVTEQAETEFIAKPALEKIPNAIVEKQSFAVDTVSGATVTSKAIINAAKDAAAQAGLDVEAMSAE